MNEYWVKKNDSEKIRVSINEFNGKTYIDIRQHYERDGEYLPTKKGVTIPLDRYGELKEAVLALENDISAEVPF